jgi:co-chaperonin GroES (HSP10)
MTTPQNLLTLSDTLPAKVAAKHGMVLVERDPREVKRGAILLPDQAQKVANRGTVISAGKGVYDDEGKCFIPIEVKPGDKVVFAPQNLRPVAFSAKKGDPAEYVFVPYYSILATVED